MFLTRINIDQQNCEKKSSLNIFLLISVKRHNIRLKEKIQKVCNEDDFLALKATPNEHFPFTLEHCLVTRFNYSKLSFPLPIETKITTLNNHLTNLSNY